MKPKSTRDVWLLVYSLIVGVGLGGFILWALAAPLSEGVTTSGQIIVEQNRKTLQHLEGGIIREIHVAEGDLVNEGDLIFDIDALAITANRDQVAYESASLKANADRLTALLAGVYVLEFASKDSWSVSADGVASIEREQKSLFREQTENYRTKIALLDQRIESLNVGEAQRATQIEAINDNIDAVEHELTLTQQLVEEKLVPVNELFRLQRETARMQTEKASLAQEVLENGSQAIEIEKQILQIKAEFREDTSRELLETRSAIAKADEQLKAIEDSVVRSKVLAPNTGKVMNLKFSTIGGVVQPGEPMLEIVPDSEGAWASVQIMPGDRDTVTESMKVRVRLTGFQSWQTPHISGEIVTISADLKHVPETGASYYEARLFLNPEDMKSSRLPEIFPGMPIQAFISAGSSRTLASYLVEPIYAHIRKGLSSG